MRKRFFSTLAAIVLILPIAVLADTTLSLPVNTGLNLDNGKTGAAGTGDISWDGTNINLVGSATGVDLPGAAPSLYSTLTGTTISVIGQGLAANPITPAANDLIIVKTNGGNYSKIEVNSISGSTLSIKFNTFGGSSTGGGGGPTITSVVNNYSFIPAGFTNSGISPGTIFTVFGSGMSSSPGNSGLNSSASPGIPTTSAGASLSVTVGGKTVTPGIYFASPGQIAAVLPSSTPTGAATITVSFNNQTSDAFQFQVVPYAPGLGNYLGGLVIATNPSTGALYGYTNSAKPGDTIVLWGSGFGADTADSDTVFTSTPHAVNTPLAVYFGGAAGKILYAGSSGYPGLNQIDVTIPEGASSGCYVGVVAVAGSGSNLVTSNFGWLPIGPSGGECTDPIFGTTGVTISTLSGQSTVRSGDVFVGQLISPTSDTDNTPKTDNLASAIFSKDTGSSYATSGGSAFSLGACSVTEVVSGGGGTGSSTGLDAGNISLTGPAGTYQLMSSPLLKGFYSAPLPANAITSSGGAFTFNGSGGADVGSFNATINLPNPLLNWTNQSADATVSRAQGVTVNWTGGGPGTYVIISGDSSDINTGVSGSFTYITNQSVLTFTVPNYITSTLPAGSGSLSVENAASYGTFKATGIDYGISFGFTGTRINATYQ